ncbi:unnamed protein product [Cuscuta epithymum]|uniref:Uncharacterized protein n=1 Tax=Cuscuta epithymum TaxID=186058 RepID=A0AAV0E302_9ASTE|nr:unnamed protein product [Cuscuta epithymum]
MDKVAVRVDGGGWLRSPSVLMVRIGWAAFECRSWDSYRLSCRRRRLYHMGKLTFMSYSFLSCTTGFDWGARLWSTSVVGAFFHFKNKASRCECLCCWSMVCSFIGVAIAGGKKDILEIVVVNQQGIIQDAVLKMKEKKMKCRWSIPLRKHRQKMKNKKSWSSGRQNKIYIL